MKINQSLSVHVLSLHRTDLDIAWFTKKTMIRNTVHVATLLVGLFFLFGANLSTAHAAATINFQVIPVDVPDPVEVGETMTYRFAWSCSGSTSECAGFSLEHTLSPNLELINAAQPTGYTRVISGTTITWDGPAADGASIEALLEVRVRYDSPTGIDIPLDGTTTIEAGGESFDVTVDPPVTVTVDEAEPQWSVSKTKIAPAGDVEPVVNGDITYQLSYCSDSAIGNVSVADATMVDTFPANATVIEADGGTVTGNTITWALGTLEPQNGCVTRTVTLRYESAQGFSTGDTVVNTVEGTGDFGSGGVGIGTGSVTNTLSDPTIDVTFEKNNESHPIGPDALAEFRLNWDTSASNIPIQDFVVVDNLPDELQIRQIRSGRWEDFPEIKARLEYSTDDGATWTAMSPVVDYDDNEWFRLRDSDFLASTNAIRWVFFDDSSGVEVYEVPAGFQPTNNGHRPRVRAKSAITVTVDTEVDNCAEAQYLAVDGVSTAVEQNCGSVTLVPEETTVVDIDKRSSNSNDRTPGEQVNFEIRMQLMGDSSGDLVNPVVRDILPPELTFISWDNVASDFDVQPVFTVTENYSGTAQTLLEWSWDDPGSEWTIPHVDNDRQGQSYSILYTAEIKPGTPAGTYQNDAELEYDNMVVNCNNKATCSDQQNISVLQIAQVYAEKWIDGYPGLNHIDSETATGTALFDWDAPFDASCPADEDGFTRYPCVAQGLFDENFAYKLKVFNTGNVGLIDYILYDVFPYRNDVGVSEILSADERESDWAPQLVGPVTAISLPTGIANTDLIFEYSDSSDPCRPEMSQSAIDSVWQTGCVDDWTDSPDVWSDVRSMRIRFADNSVSLGILESMTMSMTMYIPEIDVPSSSIAWNSIGHRATNEATNARLLTADPRKVGIVVPFHDWGDLPDADSTAGVSPSYSTDTTNSATGISGPAHLIRPDLYLGDGVDAEDDGQSSIGANGDDNGSSPFSEGTVAGNDDEDGVVFGNEVIMPGDTVEISVTAFISGAAGLQATVGLWIDMDGDGNFTDANEFHTATVTNPSAGANNVVSTFSFPAPSEVGDAIYTRVRVSFDADEVGQIDDHEGPAKSGEVEDYVLMSLGDLVWLDNGIASGGSQGTPDDGVVNGGEQGVDGVTVELYHDGDTPGTSTPIATTTTADGGLYKFTGLPEGDYVVHIPSGNFTGAGQLLDLYSSDDSTSGIGNDPDSDQNNNDDNGVDNNNPASNGISSQAITLSFGDEPTNDGNNANSNLTVDFGFVQYDWGDLPDGNNTDSPSYNTLDANNGPHHTLIPDLYMGAGVDAEGNGQPSATATGDDTLTGTDTSDDEDGVSIPEMIAGQSATVNVTAFNNSGADAVVYGFIDFNADGDFDDEGEVVTATVSTGTTSGTTALVFNVPVSATINTPVGARFRLSTDDALDANGAARDGEIEDYLISIIGHEYGDLPDTYGTINDGTVTIPAVHVVTDTLYFGSNIDHEGDGAEDVNAGMGASGGDDNASPTGTGTDDEDGIVFTTPFMPGETAQIQITANVNSSINGDGTAFYGAWIDLDGDGNFNGTSEYFTGSIGDETITLDVPVPAGTDIADVIYSRFRIAADANEVNNVANSVGMAATGEVEDYVLMSLGDTVWFDNDPNGLGNNGLLDGLEQGVEGVTVQLRNSGGAVIATATTDANGNYLFTGLTPSNYTVHIPATNFQSDGPLEAHLSSTGADSGDATDDNDNGIDNAAPATNGISSNTVTLAIGTEPTGDGNGANSNLSIDFGFVEYDWADLPDGNNTDSPSYNTMDANGGPSHLIVPGLYMGDVVDSELDGQPSATATGDDALTGADTADDEDGVTIPTLVAGESATIEVAAFNTTGVGATVYGFIDFNNDGTFDDANEAVTALVANGTTAGTTSLTFNVPLDAEINTPVGARFRLSTDNSLDSEDAAQDGEVEDYLVEIIGYEFGDLPDTYGTREGGTVAVPAVHIITETIYFGSNVDNETDGAPDDNAGMAATGGDDNASPDGSGPDDEDGITFVTPILAGQTAQIQIAATVDASVNGDGNAFYGAWIDLNGDGDFADASEFFTGTISNETITLNVPVPADTVVAEAIYSRFRIAADANEVHDLADSVGEAQTGEVEDYVLMSLGNRVWRDDGDGANKDNGVIDADEDGIDGVTVELYTSTDTPGTDAPIATVTTSDDGYYNFTGLMPGDYIVHLPDTNFQTGGQLAGTLSSDDTTAGVGDDPDDNDDSDDNGIDPAPSTDELGERLDAHEASGVSSAVVTLSLSDEPTNEDEGTGSDQSNLSVDFGFVPQTDLGDLPDTYGTIYNGTVVTPAVHILDGVTWFGSLVDAEANGQLDPSEGVTARGDDNAGDDEDGVEFITALPPNGTGTMSLTVSTDADGAFYTAWLDFNGDGDFDDELEQIVTTATPISTGSYAVDFDIPSFVSTTVYARFRIAQSAADVVNPVGLAPTGEVEDYVLLSLGNLIWNDNGAGTEDNPGVANDGIVNGTEAGIANVDVELYRAGQDPASDPPFATTTTDANGHYEFAVPANDYFVHIPASEFAAGQPLRGFASSIPTDENPDDDGTDNDDNGINATTSLGYLDEGVSSGVITLAENTEPTTDGNNANSNLSVDFGMIEYDLGDLPEIYTTLLITDTANITGGPRHIIADGVYLGSRVDGEPDGQPSNIAQGDDLGSGSDDEDGVSWSTLAGDTTLIPGEPAQIKVTASITGYLHAWVDWDGDNTFADSNEHIANNLRLVPGENIIKITSATLAEVVDDVYARFRFTTQDLGEDGLDYRGDPASGTPDGEIEDYVIPVRSYALGNRVWHDLDGDGVIEDGEPGIDGVTVNLLDSSGNQIDSELTQVGGYYRFDNLPAGDYQVEIPSSNFNGGPLTGLFNSLSTEVDPDSDVDSNDNGVNTGLATTAGILSNMVTLSGSSELGVEGDEPTDENDLGPTDTLLIPDHRDNLTVDFGFHAPVTVGDKVWYDDNYNGRQDSNEAGVSGVEVTLYNADTNAIAVDIFGNTAVTTTNDLGNYLFPNLPPGNYYAQFNLNTLPTGDWRVTHQDETSVTDDKDSDVNPATSKSGATGFLNAGSEDLTLDMGIWAPVSVGDLAWFDNDRDGLYEPEDSEFGVPGITVTLYSTLDTINPVAIDLTDNDGRYLFDNLPPGDYYVQFDYDALPPGYSATDADVGGSDPVTDTIDSDADETTGVTASTGFLPSTSEDMTLDLGIFAKVGVGDRVWFDDNYNGLQDESESGVPNVTVELFNALTNAPMFMTTTTDANGFYIFQGLNPGSYYVNFDLDTIPEDYNVTLRNQGEDDALDSDVDVESGSTQATGIIFSTESNLTLDMGIWAPVSVGNLVWYDDNGNGLQDVNELGVAGVGVRLLNGDGSDVTDINGDAVAAQTTDADGNYLFENLVPGQYQVIFDVSTLPTGYSVTTQDATSGGVEVDELDSDAEAESGVVAITDFIPSLSADLTLDMGIIAPVSVGNRVWYDENGNGAQDFSSTGDEPGVENVQVNLYNADGTPAVTMSGQPVEPQFTDANGEYLFTELPPGDYFVEFVLSSLPSGYAVTTQNQGSDLFDSDADPSNGRTGSTGVLTSLQSDTSLDMGIVPTVTSANASVRVGDRVWYDENGDGLQGADEGGVAGVAVMLYNADGAQVTDINGNLVVSQTTDINGAYLFENLPEGSYYVQFDLSTVPEGYEVTTQNVVSTDPFADTLDSDADIFTGVTHSTANLVNGDSDLTLDMGIVPVGKDGTAAIAAGVSVGDLVWVDSNANGVQDTDEGTGEGAGVSGVSVSLFTIDTFGLPQSVVDLNNNPVGPQTTDENGNYLFTDLPVGEYYVVFDLTTLPDGYTVTSQNIGSDDALDSDANPSTGQTDSTGFMNAGEFNFTLDMGIIPPGSVTVGDLVWYDNDGDGVQDSDEPGVASVTVNLFTSDGAPAVDPDGNPVPAQVTDANGNYLFSGLPTGNYYVVFDLATLPSSGSTSYQVTTQDAGLLDSEDSDANSTGQTANTGQLDAGAEDLTLDMGIVAPVAVGDRVWIDNNFDGLQDDEADEPGLAGVTVRIFNSDGSDVIDLSGNAVSAQTTDENGNYLFTNLPPGSYFVEFDLDSLDDTYFVTTANTGGDMLGADTLDSDADLSTGQTASTAFLPAGSQDLTLDMGVYTLLADETGSIGLTVRVGDKVWVDDNLNGIQDAGEMGVPGVTVHIFNAVDDSPAVNINGDPVAEQVTDGSGNYLFRDLPPGEYYVVFDLATLPEGAIVTAQGVGDDDIRDSDVDPDTGRTDTTGDIPGSTQFLNLDMGIYQLASIGDKVWLDEDADGGQDAGEIGIEGITVTLFNGDGTNTGQTTTTDVNGVYGFADLLPGDYYVQFTAPAGYVASPQNASNNDSADSDADPVTGVTAVTTLTSGENDVTWDAGFYLPASLGDRVWLDANGNGIQENGEVGVADVEVRLYNADGSLATTASGGSAITTTDSDGNYVLTNLIPGSYFVEFVEPAGEEDFYALSPQNASNNQATDSDADPNTGRTEVLVLEAGEHDPTWDAGLVQLTNVGDLAWLDLNGNGVQNNGEPGFPAVVVQLLNVDGTVATDIHGTPQTTFTDINGYYEFDQLIPGDYKVAFSIPAGYLVSAPDVSDNETLDSDINPTTGETAIVSLQPGRPLGQFDSTWDAGFYQPVSIGDLVWYDSNEDGVQDAIETGTPGTLSALGVPGVTVTLHQVDPVNGDVTVVGTTTTDSHGQYLFDNLPPGTYYVSFTPPAEYVVSPANNGSDDFFDSDVDPATLQTPAVTLVSGDRNPTLDMGLFIPNSEPASIGDFVWFDADQDGLQEGSEPGLAGVLVTLYDSDGNAITSVRTDATGFYQFTGLIPGDYYVEFATPPGYLPTQQDVSSIDTLDSDMDPATGQTSVTTLNPGENDTTWDAGFYVEDVPASVQGIAWFDSDLDGLQGGPEGTPETGIPGVLVELFTADGELVSSMVTGNDGRYFFDNLPAGDYYVQFSPRPEYAATVQDAGAAGTPSDLLDSDVSDNPSAFDNLRTPAFSVAAGQENVPGGDAGFHLGLTVLSSGSNVVIRPVTIGDMVWEDANEDGIRDASEVGIPNVVVKLYDEDGEFIVSTLTDLNGDFLFTNLAAGTYYVEFISPLGYELNEIFASDDDNLNVDNVVDPDTGRTDAIVLAPGASAMDNDAGLAISDPTSLPVTAEPSLYVSTIYLPIINQ
ncbi:MAG: SdrD B-like domain-containing protein [Chloroflexota bacterium]